MNVTFTKKELKTKKACDFQSGDIVRVGKYIIHIEYGEYSIPGLRSWVETTDGKVLNCWPIGSKGAWPYFIDDFISRRVAK